jgi:hypothetical protein
MTRNLPQQSMVNSVTRVRQAAWDIASREDAEKGALYEIEINIPALYVVEWNDEFFPYNSPEDEDVARRPLSKVILSNGDSYWTSDPVLESFVVGTIEGRWITAVREVPEGKGGAWHTIRGVTPEQKPPAAPAAAPAVAAHQNLREDRAREVEAESTVTGIVGGATGQGHIAGAMHEAGVTPEVAAKAFAGITEDSAKLSRNTILAYSPNACQDRGNFKLIIEVAKALSDNPEKGLVILTYKTEKQKSNLTTMLQELKDGSITSKVVLLNIEKESLIQYKQYGYDIKYLKTQDEKPIEGVENILLPALKQGQVTTEFERQFRQEIDGLLQA